MKINKLKKEFINAVSDLYPPEEAQSFFALLSEKHLGMKRIELALNPNKEVSKEIEEKIKDSIKRLQKFEPIQYILGETEFFGLPFIVNKNVLIPRPETEELVKWILSDIKAKNAPITILDLGTGSGCIAIALAKHLPNAEIVAVDISEKALKVAKQNAKLNNVTVNFIEADILNFNLDFEANYFDIIVSNPPYIRELEKAEIKDNVLKHEPKIALFVKDEDPLLFYKKINKLCDHYLEIDGFLYFELNEFLSNETDDLLLNNSQFTATEIKNDIFEKPRMLKAFTEFEARNASGNLSRVFF